MKAELLGHQPAVLDREVLAGVGGEDLGGCEREAGRLLVVAGCGGLEGLPEGGAVIGGAPDGAAAAVVEQVVTPPTRNARASRVVG
ncbi:hypothetical protein [Spirillospora sp. NPDC048819]|uniref:hypothetical protein n=1 Tax=Spirillospora sp. NPDC048819 TaxID=3155268 RepID=UPI0033E1DF46